MTLTDRQQEKRTTGIGSSEIAAVVGEHPYCTPHDIWLRKLGLCEPEVNEDAVWLGNNLEAPMAQWYAQEMKVRVRKYGRTVTHPEHSIVVASPDYSVIEPVTEERLLEVKIVGWRVEHQWSQDEEDGVPPYVMLQGQWQMGATGIKRCDVPVCFLSNGRKFIYQLQFEEGLFLNLVDLAKRFWKLVETRQAPPTDHTDSSREALRAMYRFNRAPLKVAPPEAAEWFQRRFESDRQLKQWEKEKDLCSNMLREFIGEAEGIENEAAKATWKVNATGARVLRVTDKTEKVQKKGMAA